MGIKRGLCTLFNCPRIPDVVSRIEPYGMGKRQAVQVFSDFAQEEDAGGDEGCAVPRWLDGALVRLHAALTTGDAEPGLKPGVADSENSLVGKAGLKILRAMQETEDFDSVFVGLIEDQVLVE